MPYPYQLDIPDVVRRAHDRAQTIGFPLMPSGRPIGRPSPTTAVTPMDGALLRALAAGCRNGLIGEIGTGPGVSTAWLASGMPLGSKLISCEIDPELAQGAAAFFEDRPDVEIRAGDWEQVLAERERFDLLFFDANAQTVLARPDGAAQLLALVSVGGVVVMDDLVPVEMWPTAWEGGIDHKREFALCNPRVAGVEVRTSATTVVVLATKLS